MMDFFFELFL